jgi:NADP-dependent 3-hydroxy acid dehydrogenase YdfG
LGPATTQRFVEEGAYVYILGRRQSEIDKAVRLVGRAVTGVQGDVRNLSDLAKLDSKVASDGRTLDIVVANAGFVDSTKLADVTVDSSRNEHSRRSESFASDEQKRRDHSYFYDCSQQGVSWPYLL